MRLFLILILGLYYLPCYSQTLKKNEGNSTFDNNYEIDTILEKNDPKNLDLTKHQLFIDTTRTSTFFQNLTGWKTWNTDLKTIEGYAEEIKKDFKPIKIDIKKFPSKWVSLRKLHNQFVLYDRCDGTDQRFEIADSTVNFFGPLESDVDLNFQLLKITEKEIKIELRTTKEKSADRKAIFSIKPTEKKFVYLLEYKSDQFQIKQFVTPIDKVNQFDMVVNHCPDRKIIEFGGFDK